MEKEIYIDKIAKEHDISKEAIYAEVNKLSYSNNKTDKILEKPKPIVRNNQKNNQEEISETIKKRENTIISILLIANMNEFEKIKNNIKLEDFKYELNKIIISKLYEEFEKGDININSIIDSFDENVQNHITSIMATDYEISDVNKAIEDILILYEKEKLISKKNELINNLDNSELGTEEKKELEKELSNIIIKLAKIK